MTTARERSAPNCAPLMRPMPVTMPSAGVRRISSSALRRLCCAATASAPYSSKLPASHRSAMFSRALRRPSACRRVMASGRAASVVRAWRSSTRCRSGRTVVRRRADAGSAGCGEGAPPSALAGAPAGCCTPGCAAGSTTASAASALTVSPTAYKASRSVPSQGARTSCSIFMASSTTSSWPARTASPGAASHSTTCPCRGECSVFMRRIVAWR